MITAEQLRVGNFLQTKNGKQVEVENIQYNGINLTTWSDTHYGVQSGGSDLDYEYGNLEPIPISESWLLNLEFERLFKDSNLFLSITNDIYLAYVNEKLIGVVRNHYMNSDNKLSELEFDVNIDFVHELQNLYFALKQEDLFLNEIAEKN